MLDGSRPSSRPQLTERLGHPDRAAAAFGHAGYVWAGKAPGTCTASRRKWVARLALGEVPESWQHGAVRPVDEAIAIASRFGLAVARPVTLSDSNNVVVWLCPSPVVAKVAVGHHGRLALEMSVAKHLASRGAPVVGPATEVPQ